MKKLSLILASAVLFGGLSFAAPVVKQAAPAAKTTKAAPAKTGKASTSGKTGGVKKGGAKKGGAKKGASTKKATK